MRLRTGLESKTTAQTDHCRALQERFYDRRGFVEAATGGVTGGVDLVIARRDSDTLPFVMAGLDPAIHVLVCDALKLDVNVRLGWIERSETKSCQCEIGLEVLKMLRDYDWRPASASSATRSSSESKEIDSLSTFFCTETFGR